MASLAGLRLRLFEHLMTQLETVGTRGRREASHLTTGRQGELAAYFYLRRQGFTIVARDWKSGIVRGDLDLIAWEGDTLCFVEVKTRSSRNFATAEAAVDEEKRRVLRRLAGQYLRQLPSQEVPVRFDILSVYFYPNDERVQQNKGGAGQRHDGMQNQKAGEFELFRAAFGWD